MAKYCDKKYGIFNDKKCIINSMYKLYTDAK